MCYFFREPKPGKSQLLRKAVSSGSLATRPNFLPRLHGDFVTHITRAPPLVKVDDLYIITEVNAKVPAPRVGPWARRLVPQAVRSLLAMNGIPRVYDG